MSSLKLRFTNDWLRRQIERDDMIDEIQARNDLRLAAGLPALDVATESKKMLDIEKMKKWMTFFEAIHDRVAEKVIAIFKRRDPNFEIRGSFNGGWEVELHVRKIIRRAYRRYQ